MQAVTQVDERPLLLSDEQRAAVEWGEGPLMVLAGAGTGKTAVIVERAAYLLGRGTSPPPDTSLQPENLLVLTYNVRATNELAERLERRLGAPLAARLRVTNFHAFGHHILRDERAEIGLPDQVRLLDEVGQRLLLRELRPRLQLLYYSLGENSSGTLAHFAALVNRARDELVTPGEYRAFAEERRAAFEARHGGGSFQESIEALRERGNLGPLRQIRRALHSGDMVVAGRVADREARKAAGGIGRAVFWSELTPGQRAIAEGLKPTFLRDAEALEVLRLLEEAHVYAVYQAALAERGVLDFGEQIQRAIAVFEERPNILRRYQRQYRHILVDEFQDANMAQILLLELLGRTPDRPDNVVVVGDDDQSIYRFRGASYAAFEQFRTRFGRAPDWEPTRPSRPVSETHLLTNRRSSGRILSAAGRLIAQNPRRLKADAPLQPSHAQGERVAVVVARDEADEAAAVVEEVRHCFESLPAEISLPDGSRRARRWSDVAVLYRRHRHRDLIVERLRSAGIPFTVIGGTGLFALPEIRDLEAALRVAANPDDSASLARLLSAGPWRLDAVEILRLTRAASFDGRPVFEEVAEVLRTGQIEVDVVGPAAEDGDHPATGTGSGAGPVPLTLFGWLDEPPSLAASGGRRPRRRNRSDVARTPSAGRIGSAGVRTRREELDGRMRARLEHMMSCLDPLAARSHRDGPFTLLDEYLARTSVLRDLVAVATPEAQRSVLAIGRLLRFVSTWQEEEPEASLADFIAYLDVFQETGGDLEATAALPADIDGVQCMTVYQAKGLEFEAVIVPRLVEGQFPDERSEDLIIPVELLRQRPPDEFVIAEERRLCYVAMTRARRHLVLAAVDDGGRQRASRFATEVVPEGESVDDAVLRRRASAEDAATHPDAPGMLGPTRTQPPDGSVADELERRFALRRRAAELIGALEALGGRDERERDRLTGELLAVAEEAARAVEDAGPEGAGRGGGTATLQSVARTASAGRELLRLAPLPPSFSHSQFRTYLECPLRYAFERVYLIPVPEEERKGYLSFGTMVHAAFEAFSRARREALAAGLPVPGMPELQACFDAVWEPERFADLTLAQTYQDRSRPILRAFYERELRRLSEALLFEVPFVLPVEAGDGEAPVHLRGVIDRIDRHPDGSLELIDYKTGRARTQADVDGDEQLTTYALAMRAGTVRDPVSGEPLPAPRRLTLYFTEADLALSTTRTDAQLDEMANRLVAVARRVRSGDFAATPSRATCGRCDYRRLCPNRWEG